MRSLRLSSIAALVALLAALAPSPHAPAQTGSAKDQLVGTWKLVSWKIDLGDGKVADSPYGASPAGWIMYQPDGHVCVMVARADRPKFVANSALSGTPEEIKAAFEGYAGYCGTYEVNA